MLKATVEEIAEVREYFEWQAPDLEVTFMQKVYSEAVLHTRHDVWDIHTDKDRWWVITGGTNLYSQEQFPNMDLALTFHIGLMLRVPRSDAEQVEALRIVPFGKVLDLMNEVCVAQHQAQTISDYQGIGVRCRETLLELIGAAQDAAIWTDQAPQRANFRDWTEIIANTLYSGDPNKERRSALKGAMGAAWSFANWLTHSKSSTWVDAELATTQLQHAVGMATSVVLRALRDVPEECPECGCPHFKPEQGENSAAPGVLWERPRCCACDWAGLPVPIMVTEGETSLLTHEGDNSDNCGIMAVPLRTILKPGDPKIEPLKDIRSGPPEHDVYFAYGSNMATARLRARMPSAEPIGVAALPGHVLRFHKRSKDGSGKCDAFETGGDEDVVFGVLFKFDPAERPALDQAEAAGKGYDPVTVTVINKKGNRRKVLTYRASPEHIDDRLKPYGWYMDHVLAGAAEHGLPETYVETRFHNVEAVEDLNRERDAKERQLHTVAP
jgi:hypothetical protein